MTLEDSPLVPNPYDPWFVGWDRVERKFGLNGDLNAASGGEDIIAQGGDAFLPTTAGALTIVSDSTDDDVGGTGATEVTLYYLDANWQDQVEVLALDGTHAVTASATAIRAPRVKITGAGSGEAAAGTITIAIGGTTVNIIAVGTAADPSGQTLYCCDTIPATTQDGYTVVSARVLGWVVSMLPTGAGEIQFSLLQRPLGEVWQKQDNAWVDASQNGNPPPKIWPVPLTVGPQTDLKVRAASITGNNQVAAATFYYYLVC